jgi:hypothetical protein
MVLLFDFLEVLEDLTDLLFIRGNSLLKEEK